MSVADKTGAFEVLLVPRYCLFAPKHPKWPTNGRSSPNGRNTRYSSGPNRAWDHSAHPMGGPVPHLWGLIAPLFPAERPKTPFWALFALPPRAVAGDHFYGPGDPPHGGNIGRGVRWGRLARGGAGGHRLHTGFQRAVRACALRPKMGAPVRPCTAKSMWKRSRTRPPALSEVVGPFGPQMTQRAHLSRLIPTIEPPGNTTVRLFKNGSQIKSRSRRFCIFFTKTGCKNTGYT